MPLLGGILTNTSKYSIIILFLCISKKVRLTKMKEFSYTLGITYLLKNKYKSENLK